MKTTHLVFSCVATLAGSVSASTSGVPVGPGLTVGPTPLSSSMLAARHNPANASLLIKSDEQLRMNYLPGIAIGTEVGDANNFADDLEDLIDILDDPGLASATGVQATLDRFNAVLHEMGEEGFVKVDARITAPLLPLYWRPKDFKGTFSFELDGLRQIRLGVLDDELTYDNDSQSFETATSGYLKSGIQTTLAVGYSQQVFEDKMKEYGGQLYAGVKVKVISLELSKQVLLLQQLESEDDVDEIIEDEYDYNLKKSTTVGIDVGVTWVADRYRVGFTLANLNSPSFDYGPIGLNCEDRPENTLPRSNCQAADYFIGNGEIQARETHTKHAAASVDAAFSITDNWAVTGSFDLAKYDDIVGMNNQWMNVSTAYVPDNFWIPGLRAGYHKNLSGSELSVVSAGFTFFTMLHLDLQMALDEVTVDGSTGPRSTAFSLSLEERF